MHLLKIESSGKKLRRHTFYDNLPPYAILSHRWLPLHEEPTFQDLSNGTGQEKAGHQKLLGCAQLAACDKLNYFSVDTVCIDKTSSAELTESLNSMFKWYRESQIC